MPHVPVGNQLAAAMAAVSEAKALLVTRLDALEAEVRRLGEQEPTAESQAVAG